MSKSKINQAQAVVNFGDEIIKNFTKNAASLDDAIANLYLNELGKVDIKNLATAIPQIEKKIIDNLLKAGWITSSEGFIGNLKELYVKKNAFYDNKFNPENINKFVTQNTISNLADAGLRESFINPLKTSAFQFATGAKSYESIKADVYKNTLSSYAETITNDAVYSYQRAIDQQIYNTFGKDNEDIMFLWVGSLVIDSRPLCRYVIRGYPNGISKKDLIVALANYPEGQIKGTTIDNVSSVAGGWGCKQTCVILL